MKLLLALLVGLTGATAHALILEPYGGYQRLTINYENKSGGTGSVVSSGLGLGGRIAYDFLGLYAGGDIYYASTTATESGASGSSSSSQATHLIPYLLAGYSIPVLPLKAWIGYSPMNTHVIKGSSGDITYTGTALKVGVGYSILPLVAINLEYLMQTFDKVKTSSGESSVSSVFSKVDTSGFFLGASITL